ncbi:hypothetical protein L6452_34793 [Arctium lappa]|uniref:Uncharacterized protein n=1 Tax=Arctium lappa TaxID=4217 RepID=A0ACB8YKD1_ARCLA|nr:hypothetical protein L6452_34793 [Arctium lappa]
MDIVANTTLITNLTNQIGSVRDKIDSQDQFLKEILHHLKNHPTPATSFTDTGRKDLQMVVEFDVLATASFAELEDKVEKQTAMHKKKDAAKKAKKAKKTQVLVEPLVFPVVTTSLDDDKGGEKTKEDAKYLGGAKHNNSLDK